MGYVDHLKNNNSENLVLEVAFGTHLIQGDLAKSISDGTNVYIQQMLGEAYGKGWKGLTKGLWFAGLKISETQYKFYPGIISPSNADATQGQDAIFDKDTPHSNTCWIRAMLPADVASSYQDNQKNPPTEFRAIADCQIGDIYDDAGNVIDTDVFLSNAADAAAFICKVIREYPDSRIDWASLDVIRQHFNATETPDWTTFPVGAGLTGSYYSSASPGAFSTLILTRIDPIIEFDNSTGSPAFQMDADNFAVRWEGKIKPEFSETYTIYVTHDDGARVYITNLTTAIIDQWADTSSATHSATIALTANQFEDIKVEWYENGGDAEILLEWSSASQPRQVIPQERLYPKAAVIAKYKCGAKFIEETDTDTALRTVLRQSNAFYQDADGVLSFYSYDLLEPTFHFSVDNVAVNTFKKHLRYTQTELRDQPTRLQAIGRDTDSQYLEDFSPPVYFEITDNQFGGAGHIRTRTVDVGNCNRFQAYKLLVTEAKLTGQGWIVEFEGQPETYPVLPGDMVTMTWGAEGWTLRQFLVLEASDKSITSNTGTRIFQLLEWS